ncbi:DUF2461 domain-containing protein [Pseudoflavitalea rhizosphaerae]|uniref:DUF2461 domain-containing protein n=1 Tax=Pseudoflavitalea rhizosphaerae TaxID=1884793 RepID=UPI000F8DDFA5|nr:DUF2461 domain-containing protein [Pseudoflavitalea rhizosphaerae]
MQKQPQIPASSLRFLNQLSKNNNRDWFQLHKTEFQQEQEKMAAFAEALLQALSLHDQLETRSGKESLHRIYRDTRFSQNKTPYKSNWSGRFKRATKYRRGGYYYNIEPGNSFIAGGFWGPVPADLKRIREDIAFDNEPLRKIINSKTFKSSFGALKGEQVKTAPKGFDANHEAIDLLRYKQFLLIRHFTDEEVLGTGFLKAADLTFRHMRPFFDYMSELLSTDANGE